MARRLFRDSEGRLNLFWRLSLYCLSWWIVFILALVVVAVPAKIFGWQQRTINLALAPA